MPSNENISYLMNHFDLSEPLPAGYSTAELSNAAKQLNSKDENGQTNVKIPSKVVNLVKIIKKCVENINANLVSKYPNAKPFNVEKNITFNSLSATGKIELISSDGATHLSFNIQKLSKLPSLEVSAIITKTVADAIAKENGKENDSEFYQQLLIGQQNENKKENQIDGLESRAKEIIAAYLKSYLPAIYADDFKKFDNVSEYIAGLIVEEFGENDLKKIINSYFDLESLDIDVMAVEKVDAFLGRARITRLYGKATELAEDPEKEVLSLGFMQQAQSLLGTDTTDLNYHNLAKKFEAIGSTGERCLTGAAVKEFCLYYVQNYLHASNVKNFEVTFEPKGALGSYRDGGATQSININLEKLKKMGSFTELAMTLSHELTHAVDSTKNKTQGIYNENGGGLIGDIENSIAGSGATGEVKELLVKLKKFTYHINPNERHARIGELSALVFMQKVGSTDSRIQSEMKTSVEKYIRYQQITIDMIKSLPQKLAEFKNEYNNLLSSGELDSGSVAAKMIEERISYLEEHGKEISFEEELKSQQSARDIMEGKLSIEIEAQKQRDAEEERRKQEEMQELERQL